MADTPKAASNRRTCTKWHMNCIHSACMLRSNFVSLSLRDLGRYMSLPVKKAIASAVDSVHLVGSVTGHCK
jgi:hypothetical protein